MNSHTKVEEVSENAVSGESKGFPNNQFAARSDTLTAITIWAAIGLTVIALLFPPYGYSSYKEMTGIVNLPQAGLTESRTTVPWRYLGHRFLFADPPQSDARLFTKPADGIYSIPHILDMRIGWHIIAIEIGIVTILAGGIIVTFRRRFGSYVRRSTEMDSLNRHPDKAGKPINAPPSRELKFLLSMKPGETLEAFKERAVEAARAAGMIKDQ